MSGKMVKNPSHLHYFLVELVFGSDIGSPRTDRESGSPDVLSYGRTVFFLLFFVFLRQTY